MSRGAARRERSVFRTVAAPLLGLVLAQVLLLIAGLGVSGVVSRLDQNARDMLSQQVHNRQDYLENAMVRDWSDLTRLAGTINESAQALLEDGTISLEELDSSSEACAPLLREVSGELVSTLYAKKVSGIFVVFNGRDLSGLVTDGGCPDKTGIYIRDLDPASTPSQRNADLLLEVAPIDLVRALGISTDTGWRTTFTFGFREDTEVYDFLRLPFQAAYDAGGETAADACGFWSAGTSAIHEACHACLTYSIPLILADGTVYGVLGIEILPDYLESLMPAGELFENGQGTYILAAARDRGDGSQWLDPVVASGQAARAAEGQDSLILAADGTLELKDRRYYAVAEQFQLSGSSSAFEDGRWVLVGMVGERTLYAFSGQFTLLLALALLLMALVGVSGSLLISRRLARPIRDLSEEVGRAQDDGEIPRLSATGITEIDRFAQAITGLSRDVVDSSTRFLRIMDMASVELGGFEVREGADAVFVTDNFFPMLGVEGVDPSAMTRARFRELMTQLDNSRSHTKNTDGSTLYRVVPPQGEARYVRVEVTQDGSCSVGLAEDVTDATVERLRIEHERDYDLLTGLLNRRAFYEAAEKLFSAPDKLGHAALLMLDLDNLKRTNDRFGHDWGDQYIRQAGQCFAGSVPAGTLCARVSGDEFFLLFHGYHSQQALRQDIGRLGEAIRSSQFYLPSGACVPLSASGGVAWYPEDGTQFNQLMKYADFAMYQVKQSRKGELADFDLGTYNRESFLAQSRRELSRLLEHELAYYHFQAIVDAATGAPRAYEALMRVDLPTLRTPDAVLQLARKEGRLDEIEHMTWYGVCATYQALLDQGMADPEALLFLNSIASQALDRADWEELARRFPALLARVVVEITEAEEMDPEATAAKRAAPGLSGLFALDDYGSGYNSQKNLLALAPRYIKVDTSIVREIDADPDKQQIVASIVSYAHQRDMLIVAEGLETERELACALDLGVDLLQGFFLSRPAAVPGAVSPEALAIIRAHHRKRKI